MSDTVFHLLLQVLSFVGRKICSNNHYKRELTGILTPLLGISYY